MSGSAQGATNAVPGDGTGAGRLVVCPTPLGNLGDMTARSRDALAAADVVCAEDTRVTGKLLAALGIKNKLERLDEATMRQRAEGLVERMASGQVVAYCSDAGMPGVSDPGMHLVRLARAAGVTVEVLPGPTAAATAYVASGTEFARFFFGGFFPRKRGEQQALLDGVASLDAALIFYESPNRLVDALAVLAERFPYREGCVCRELTKLHEEVVRDTLPQLAALFAERACAFAAGEPGAAGIRGEIALVIDGPSEREAQAAKERSLTGAEDRARQLLAQGVRSKDAARQLSQELNIPKNDAYQLVLKAGRR
ncbi:16S rRNA (cytidine(1402)-2'-O)-methyltransferase [Adlercreutzia aquisgranensis]|uniref:16S rRNA (cytidine(1402)-2'-O)-methyltransferase n=1 Tax=Adlercreutzia aquisgranensis TaxID=2941323 RepID=UPI0020418709|nr:16S rRNA (cytidine(1402)-2'-O)-methyltransferase [Adlercreutzia aquisgranensis]